MLHDFQVGKNDWNGVSGFFYMIALNKRKILNDFPC